MFVSRDRAHPDHPVAVDLSDYRVLAFATHGLVSGELSGLGEPALVFTPPETGTEADDGLLTASEIATLKLDADWVILSACNTAAADGTPGAEGLSGMAKAFFYAAGRGRCWSPTGRSTPRPPSPSPRGCWEQWPITRTLVAPKPCAAPCWR